MVKAALGKEPPLGFNQIHDSGVVVLDLTTVLEVACAAQNNSPVLDKVLTINTPKGPLLCEATIGTSLEAIVDEMKIDKNMSQVVIGGLLTGRAHQTIDYPVTSDLTCISLIPKGNVTGFANEPCINCGLCTSVCPARLIPGLLSKYCEFKRFDKAEAAHIWNCIECGCCAYVCPSERSMVQFMTHGKKELLSQKEEN